jgi:hypothetical protein
MQMEQVKWRRTVAAVSGILLGIVFLVSGGWKVLDPFKTGELLVQAQVPAGLGVVGAASLGTPRFCCFIRGSGGGAACWARG